MEVHTKESGANFWVYGIVPVKHCANHLGGVISSDSLEADAAIRCTVV